MSLNRPCLSRTAQSFVPVELRCVVRFAMIVTRLSEVFVAQQNLRSNRRTRQCRKWMHQRQRVVPSLVHTDGLEHDPEKAWSGPDPGWTPVFGKSLPSSLTRGIMLPAL